MILFDTATPEQYEAVSIRLDTVYLFKKYLVQFCMYMKTIVYFCSSLISVILN